MTAQQTLHAAMLQPCSALLPVRVLCAHCITQRLHWEPPSATQTLRLWTMHVRVHMRAFESRLHVV